MKQPPENPGRFKFVDRGRRGRYECRCESHDGLDVISFGRPERRSANQIASGNAGDRARWD